MSARSLAALVSGALLSACIGAVQIATPKPEPPPPPVPERFTGEGAPELVASPVEGCQVAPSLDPNLYYCAKEEHWYRFAMNRWFLAFSWDGNWFPASGAELPAGLRKITPQTEIEATKTREQRLEELERRLEELEGEEQAP